MKELALTWKILQIEIEIKIAVSLHSLYPFTSLVCLLFKETSQFCDAEPVHGNVVWSVEWLYYPLIYKRMLADEWSDPGRTNRLIRPTITTTSLVWWLDLVYLLTPLYNKTGNEIRVKLME